MIAPAWIAAARRLPWSWIGGGALVLAVVGSIWLYGRGQYRAGVAAEAARHVAAAIKQQASEQARVDDATRANIIAEEGVRNATQAAVDAGRDGQRIDTERVQSINDARAKIAGAAAR